MANLTEARLRGIVEFVLQDKGLLDLKTRLDQAEKGLAGARAGMAGFASATGLASTAAKSLLGVLAPLVAAGGIARFFYQSATGQEEMARTTQALEQRVRALGLPVAETMEGIQSFVSTLQAASGVTDDELVPAFTQMLGLTGSVKGAMGALQTAVAMSKSGMGTFSEAIDGVAAILAGRAGEALKKYGINQRDAAGHTKTNRQMTLELLAALDGQAEKAAKSESAASKLSGAWDSFGDTIGTGLIPVLNSAREILAGVLDWATRMAGRIELIGVRARLLPQVIAASIKNDQLRLMELQFIEDTLVAAVKSKWSDVETSKTEGVRIGAELRAALLEAAAQKDKEAQEDAARKAVEARARAAEEINQILDKSAQLEIDRLRKVGEETSKQDAEHLASVVEQANAEAAARLEAQVTGDEAEWDAYNDLLNSERELLADDLAAREQLELEAEEARWMAANLEAVRKINDKAQLDATLETLEQAHQNRVAAIEKKGAKIAIDLAKMKREQQLQATAQAFGALAGAFPKIKAFAVAEALISTYLAATRALEAGPILGPILAAMIVAAGLANVAKIRKSEPGLAEGAFAIGPRRVVVGEAGPELVMPTRGSRAEPYFEGIGRGIAAAMGSSAAGGEQHFHGCTFVGYPGGMTGLYRGLQRVGQQERARRIGG